MPFCAASCPYCDYPHAVASDAHGAFVDALLAEIRQRVPASPVQTVYLGGGTPSQLSAGQVKTVLDAIRDAFGTGSVDEVTVEGNPDDLSGAWLRAVRDAGVDRLSLGVQSFFEGDLRFLGRRHAARESARALPIAREAGFENVSLDLLFGLPGQSLARWRAVLDEAVRQRPEHVTLYRLTAEPGTPLGRRVAGGAATLPEAETAGAQYEAALDVLEAAGFRLYEQTHLARPGFEAAHTARYWRHAPVLGLGPGAHSFCWSDGSSDGSPEGSTATRRRNAPGWRAYVRALSAGDAAPHTQETLAPAALADEYIAQRLRTARGLSLQALATRYGRDLRAERGPTLDRLRAEAYLEVQDGRLCPTRAGRLRLDALTAALL